MPKGKNSISNMDKQSSLSNLKSGKNLDQNKYSSNHLQSRSKTAKKQLNQTTPVQNLGLSSLKKMVHDYPATDNYSKMHGSQDTFRPSIPVIQAQETNHEDEREQNRVSKKGFNSRQTSPLEIRRRKIKPRKSSIDGSQKSQKKGSDKKKGNNEDSKSEVRSIKKKDSLKDVNYINIQELSQKSSNLNEKVYRMYKGDDDNITRNSSKQHQSVKESSGVDLNKKLIQNNTNHPDQPQQLPDLTPKRSQASNSERTTMRDEFEEFRKRSLSRRSSRKSSTGNTDMIKKNKDSIKYIKPSIVSSRRSLSSSRNKHQEPNNLFNISLSKQRTIQEENNHVLEKSQLTKLRQKQSRSTNGIDFYEKYEVLGYYSQILSVLKLPKVHFGFRPKLWSEEKLYATIEEILTFRAELQKKYHSQRLKSGSTKLTIHCINDVTTFIQDYAKEKYEKSQVLQEKLILELLWTLENYKHECSYLNLFSQLLASEIPHQVFMFFLMSREHVLSLLRKQLPGSSVESIHTAVHNRNMEQMQCVDLIYDLVMSYEGQDIGEQFLTAFFELTNIQEENFLKISEFLVAMVNIYEDLVKEGVVLDLVRFQKSSKVSQHVFKPSSHILNEKLTNAESSNRENINWFMWNDNNLDQISGTLQRSKMLFNSTSKSKVFRRSNKSLPKMKLSGPDLSRGRYDEKQTKSISRKEIEELLRQPRSSRLDFDQQNKYYYKNFSPEAEYKRKTNLKDTQGNKIPKSKETKLEVLDICSKSNRAITQSMGQFNQGKSVNSRAVLARIPQNNQIGTRNVSKERQNSNFAKPSQKLGQNVKKHGISESLLEKSALVTLDMLDGDTLEFSKHNPATANNTQNRTRLLDSTLFNLGGQSKKKYESSNNHGKSNISDNLSKIYISGGLTSNSDDENDEVKDDQNQSSKMPDFWGMIKLNKQNNPYNETSVEDSEDLDGAVDSDVSFSPVKKSKNLKKGNKKEIGGGHGDNSKGNLDYEIYHSLDHDSLMNKLYDSGDKYNKYKFDKNRQGNVNLMMTSTSGVSSQPIQLNRRKNKDFDQRRISRLVKGVGHKVDNELFDIFDNLEGEEEQENGGDFRIKVVGLNENFGVNNAVRKKIDRRENQFYEAGNSTQRTFSKKDYLNVLENLEPETSSRSKTLEEINQMLKGIHLIYLFLIVLTNFRPEKQRFCY